METLIDLCFMVDVFLNCITSYEQDDGHMITDVTRIVKHYMRTWFVVGVMSSMPFDLISALVNGKGDSAATRICCQDAQDNKDRESSQTLETLQDASCGTSVQAHLKIGGGT